MKVLKIAAVLALSLFINACSKSDQNAGADIAASQQKSMEKAESVEGMVEDADQKKREAAGMEEPATMEGAAGGEEAAPMDQAGAPDQPAEMEQPAEPEAGANP